jgi:alpha-L-fucosidase
MPSPAKLRTHELGLPQDSWFRGAGLGLFVHWDHASQQGIEISWPIVGKSIIPGINDAEDRVTPDQYHSSAPTFNPQKWDAETLASTAKDAGATYVVFTTRHHGGYSMFHTEYSDFSIETSPFKRDITREFADAVRAAGLRVGFYYSLPDWHHPDYPAFTEDQLPYPKEHWPGAGLPENADKPIATDKHRRPTAEQWDRYLEYVRGQLTELLTNYGQVDLLWFDGEWERSAEEWRTEELRTLIKSLQPDVVINDRLLEQGDYRTPEQGLPATPSDGPWELCLTMGQMWAWRPNDTKYKSSRQLISTLIEVVSRGGNLLLNVAPTEEGELVPLQVERLNDISEWMKSHQESVIGVSSAPDIDFYGPVTRSNAALYLHLLLTPVEEVVVRGLEVGRVKKVSLLGVGEPLDFETNVEVHEQVTDEAGQLGELRLPAPAPSGALIDVIAIEFE